MMVHASKKKAEVYLRVRPLNKKEKSDGAKKVWTLDPAKHTIQETTPDGSTVRRVNGKSHFVFDMIFDENVSTVDVYEMSSIKNVVLNVLAGENGTICVYGQTASGKTHTIFGSKDSPGVVQLAVQDILEQVKVLHSSGATFPLRSK